MKVINDCNLCRSRAKLLVNTEDGKERADTVTVTAVCPKCGRRVSETGYTVVADSDGWRTLEALADHTITAWNERNGHIFFSAEEIQALTPEERREHEIKVRYNI